MDWLNDKKNQPIIIGIVVALLLGVGAFYYFMLSPKDEGDTGGVLIAESIARTYFNNETSLPETIPSCP